MEGIVKYRFYWDRKPLDILSEKQLQRFNYWRSALRQRGVLGEDENKQGFGNISIRLNTSERFIITGSQTGHLDQLCRDALSLVTEYSITGNYVSCSGLSKASSEALTHAAFYRHSKEYRAVIHFHSKRIWDKERKALRMSDPNAHYGTPELAVSIERILREFSDSERPVIIMGGHPAGVITFGESLEKAGTEALKLINKHYD